MCQKRSLNEMETREQLTQLRKNSIGLLQAHIEKGICPNSLRYNVGQKSQMRILHKIYKLNQKESRV